MRHLDLFSGIGGFAYAIDQVWSGVEHTFCDNEEFCQQILKRHWPESRVYGDIREYRSNSRYDIVTGGFPCQPFSSVGLGRGTADERHLWPEMFRVVRLAKPAWVVAENVRGLVTWNDGLVLEQVCTDLESEGYEVQPLIIPSVAVNAPHKRDRVWIVAYSPGIGLERSGKFSQLQKTAQDAGLPEWSRDWLEAASELCGMGNGIPNRVDRLKSLGNAIVPQVAIEIMKAIRG